MIVQQLITVLGIKADESKLKRADELLKNIAKGAGLVAGAATAAAGGLVLLAKQAADAGDEVAKTSKKLGVSTDALQELRHAGQLAGVETTVVNNSLRDLGKNVGEAALGSQSMKDAFNQMGVSIRDGNGKLRATEDILLDMADASVGMQDEGKKNALLMRLMGESGIQMRSLLDQGTDAIKEQAAEAHALGAVLGEDALKASEEFADSQTRLFARLNGIRTILGVKLMPIMDRWVKRASELIDENRELIDDVLDKLVDFVEEVSKGLAFMLSLLLKGFDAWKKYERLIIITAALTAGTFALWKTVTLLQFAFSAAGRQAIIAWAQILAPILFVTAAIAVLALLIEDLFTFVSGDGKSAIGELVKEWGAVGEAIVNARDFWLQFSEDLADGTTSFGKIFEDAWEGAKLAAGDLFDFVMQKIAAFSTEIADVPVLGTILTAGGDAAAAIESGVNDLFSSFETPATAAAGGVQNINFNSTAQLDVREGAGGVNLPGATRALRMAQEDQIREASRQLSGTRGLR